MSHIVSYLIKIVTASLCAACFFLKLYKRELTFSAIQQPFWNNYYGMPPMHPIIGIWNNRIQNDHRINEKVYWPIPCESGPLIKNESSCKAGAKPVI